MTHSNNISKKCHKMMTFLVKLPHFCPPLLVHSRVPCLLMVPESLLPEKIATCHLKGRICTLAVPSHTLWSLWTNTNICAEFVKLPRWEIYHFMQLHPKEQPPDSIAAINAKDELFLWQRNWMELSKSSHYIVSALQNCAEGRCKKAWRQKLHYRSLKGNFWKDR